MLSYNEFKEAVLAESVEQLDELSKKTLGSYIKNAALDSQDHAADLGAQIPGSFKKMNNRNKGIAKAVNKLTKEEHEVLESLLAKLED
jgi:hypothetical protein